VTLELPMDLLRDVFGTRDITAGMSIRLPGDVVLFLLPLPIRNRRVIHDTSPPIPVQAIFNRDTSVALFVPWLHSKLVEFHHPRVVICGSWIEAEPKAILEAVVLGLRRPNGDDVPQTS